MEARLAPFARSRSTCRRGLHISAHLAGRPIIRRSAIQLTPGPIAFRPRLPFLDARLRSFRTPVAHTDRGAGSRGRNAEGSAGQAPGRGLHQGWRATTGQPARLLLLDGASAVVLHNESAYTRAIGPGLSVSRGNEHIAGVLDLRKQRRCLGPLPEEDPFAPQGLDESQVAYHARQHRRGQTSAITSDNVEVAARIEVELRVEGREGQGGSAFGFQADAAWRAIAYEGVAAQTPSDARGRQLSWDWLPVHLAADLWREYLRKFPIVDLFEQTRDSHTTLEFIGSCINKRLQEAIVPELDERGAATGRQYSSPEYQILRSRGLRVLSVNIREVHLEREQAEAHRIADWAAAWEQRAVQRQQDAGASKADSAAQSRKAAAIKLARRASRALYLRLLKTDGRAVPPPDEKETLELLISGALDAGGANQKLRMLANQLKNDKESRL